MSLFNKENVDIFFSFIAILMFLFILYGLIHSRNDSGDPGAGDRSSMHDFFFGSKDGDGGGGDGGD